MKNKFKNRLKHLNKKEYLIKGIIAACLLVSLVISFFFADKIENAFKMKTTYGQNQVEENALKTADYKVSYLNVGQGNCTVIELPDGRTALIDGGDASHGREVYEFLKDKKIFTIDFLIATHADADHIGGLNYLFSKLEIKNIYRPFQIAGRGDTIDTFVPIESEDLKEVYHTYYADENSKISRVTSNTYIEFITNVYKETYSENGNTYSSNVSVFYDGFEIVGNYYTFEFFAPLTRNENIYLLNHSTRTHGFATVGYGSSNSNDNSAIFTFKCGEHTYLFTGDATCSNSSGTTASTCEELAFVDSLTYQDKEKLSAVSVYLAGHHGSESSSSSQLLKLINPKFVVVSVAKENDYGHPHKNTLRRIAGTKNLEKDYLLCTDEKGSIIFSNANGRLCYVALGVEEDKRTILSYELFATIVFVFLIVVVFSVKPRKNTKVKNIDTKSK